MNYTRFFTPILALIIFAIASAQNPISIEPGEKPSYPKAQVSYTDFKELLLDVESKRANRLLCFDDWLAMSNEPNTIILDTRSAELYKEKHIKGAYNLPYTEFTQAALKRIIPDPNTRILIYCNNNFYGDPIFFASKKSRPNDPNPGLSFAKNQKPRMLALNIPTYITLFGYGYENIYELDEFLSVRDPRVEFHPTLEKNALRYGFQPVPMPSPTTEGSSASN